MVAAFHLTQHTQSHEQERQNIDINTPLPIGNGDTHEVWRLVQGMPSYVQYFAVFIRFWHAFCLETNK